MLIGFFLRRIVTVTLCAGAFWLGMKTDRVLSYDPTAASAAARCAEDPNGQ